MAPMTRRPLADRAEPAVLGDAAAADRFLSTPSSKRFANDPLGRELYALISLHPQLPARFREVQIEELNNAAKQALIDEISNLLGV